MSFADYTAQCSRYLLHQFVAEGPHGIHSPFAFDLLTRVLVPQRLFYCFESIELERIRLLSDHRLLEIDDFGAGSRGNHSHRRSVASIASNSLTPKKKAQVIFRLVENAKPSSILELGTSLGIMTSYLAHTNKDCRVVTIEGASTLAVEAQTVFDRLKLKNVALIQGKFDDVLPETLSNQRFDIALVDGNHTFDATLRYAKQLIPCVNQMIIFDDIYWSRGMTKAWKEIISLPQVDLSIDFFHFGVVFVQRPMEKQHLIMKIP